MLHGKKIVVTGAGGALGSAVADAAQRHGAQLILIDLKPGAPRPNADWYGVDMRDASAVAAALGGVDVDALLHVAGGFAWGSSSDDIPDAEWDTQFAINVGTLRTMLRQIVPGMVARGRGAVVTVGALSAFSGKPLMASYCAAKASVMRLTESLSAELRDKGINVNAVAPSIIDTPANRAAMPDAEFDRWVSPLSLAEVMCFLCSPGARDVHGAVIPVAGRV